jgi:hypothetical protein
VVNPRFPSCTWTGLPVTSLYGDPTASIQLDVERARKKAFIKNEGRMRSVRAGGVGQVAAWTEITQSLDVWQGGYSVSVSVYGPYVTNSLATAKTLARIVLGRL